MTKKKNIVKGLLIANNVSQKELAKHLGINVATVNRKINNWEKRFTIGEAAQLRDLLGKRCIDEVFYEN